MLEQIQAADPEGGEVEPSAADCAAHEAWARARFGDAVWAAYETPGWGEPDSYA